MMRCDDPRAEEVDRLIREFRDEARRADKESDLNCAVPKYYGVTAAFINMLYEALPDDNHLVEYLPRVIKEKIDETKSEAVMNKLKENL